MQESKWGEALPLLEDIYTFEDALLVGLLLISLLNHADRVKVACLAQLVNVLAPIMTQPGGGAFRQTIFYPFMEASKYGRGTALKPIVRAPKHDTKDYCDVPAMDAAAIWHEDKGELVLFAVNRETEDLQVEVDLRALPGMKVLDHSLLVHSDMKAVNSFANPGNVAPTKGQGGVVDNGKLTLVLPARSWNTVRLG